MTQNQFNKKYGIKSKKKFTKQYNRNESRKSRLAVKRYMSIAGSISQYMRTHRLLKRNAKN